jgi:hypothetical protein
MALNPENRIPTTAGTNEIFFDRNTGKISYKNNLGIVTSLEGSNITNISQSAENGLNFNFKEGSIGPKVSFTKVNDSDPAINRDVIIPGQLEITRGNSGRGIYNVAVESNNNSSSPQDTFWNTQYVSDTDTSWAFLHDIEARSYTTWRNAIETPAGNAAPPQYVGMPSVMCYDNGVDKRRYWLILFTEWGVGGNNQYGFAYDRYEIYPEVLFDRPNYSFSTLDILSAEVHIARKDNGGQIYNILSELSANQGVSPEKTKWNSIYTDGRTDYSGFTNLNNLESRVYTDFSSALDNSVGNNILTTELIMWDLTTDLYYKVVFISWQSGGLGGGFSYRRTVIPQSCGIKFADGTVLNTAKGLGASGVQSVTGLDTDNTDPLNPVVQIAVDGTTVTGDGTNGNPLVATFQSPSVDGVTITGDGTPGNPLVAASGGGAVNYANVFFVDAINGDNGTALRNDFTKPYLTINQAIDNAGQGVLYPLPTNTDRALVYVRRGTYTNNIARLLNYVDIYCEPGVVFINAVVHDNSASVICNFYGKAKFTGNVQSFSNDLFRLTGTASKVYFEFDDLISSNKQSKLKSIRKEGLKNDSVIGN